MTYICVAAYDAAGRVTAFADAEDLATAESIVAIQRSEGYQYAFYCEHPGPNYWQQVYKVEASALVLDNSAIEATAEAGRIAVIKNQIVDLERLRTPRRMAEATLGEDNGWLADNVAQVVALRSQL